MRTIPVCFLILCACLLAACSPAGSAATSTPQPAATDAGFFTSDGGGEPRTPGYWLAWNSCAEGNMAETARANGGQEKGWFIMDDFLAQPGIAAGAIMVEDCQQGVSLLQGKDLQGVDRSNDPAYALAAQLVAAQLNQAAGAEDCPAAAEAISAAQLLLSELSFDGSRGYLGPPQASADVDTAKQLAEQLSNFNAGSLCRP